MKEKLMKAFSSNILISIKGKNINNFIKRLIGYNINILNVKMISYKEAELIVKYQDINKIRKYKSIYEINIKKYYGWIYLLKFIKKNIYLFCFLIIAIILLSILSNIIFKVEVIHSNKSIVNLVKKELEEYGIKKYSFIKRYDEIQKIEKKILENNKDKLEWMEIIQNGTKYTVRLEERLINKKIDNEKKYDIISSKNAIIKEIIANKGEKNKLINSYVKKGDVIISSSITLPNSEKTLVGAEGYVIGEVWYNVHIEMPYHYHEVLYTGKKRDVLVFSLFNKKIPFFNFHEYKSFDRDVKTIFNNIISPISLYKENQYETIVIDKIYTKEEAKKLAKEKVEKKLKENNKNIIDISNIIIRSEYSDKKKISLDLFVSSIENITQYKEVISTEILE